MKRMMKSLAALMLAFGLCGCGEAQSVDELSSQVAEGAAKAQEYLDENAERLGLNEEDVAKAKEIASQAQGIFEEHAREYGLYDFEEEIAAARKAAENAASQDVSLNTDSSSLLQYLGTDPKELLKKIVDETSLLEQSDAKSYEEIYERYAKKLRDETPKLIAEYQAEAAKNQNGDAGLRSLLSVGISKLALINVEGSVALAGFRNDAGKDASEEYSEWAQKLNSVYEEEALRLSEPYQESLRKTE